MQVALTGDKGTISSTQKSPCALAWEVHQQHAVVAVQCPCGAGPQKSADDTMVQLLSRSTSTVQAAAGAGPAQALSRHSSGASMHSGPAHMDPPGSSPHSHILSTPLHGQAASLARSSMIDLHRPVPSSDAPATGSEAIAKQPYPQSLQSLSPSAIEPLRIPAGARRGSDALFAMAPGRQHSMPPDTAAGVNQPTQGSPAYPPNTLVRARGSSGIPPTLVLPEKAPLGTISEIPGLMVGTPYGPSVATTPRISVASPAVQAAAAGLSPTATSQPQVNHAMRRGSTAAGMGEKLHSLIEVVPMPHIPRNKSSHCVAQLGWHILACMATLRLWTLA